MKSVKSARFAARLSYTFISRFKGLFVIGILMGLALFVAMLFLFPQLSRTTQSIGVTGRYHTDELPSFVIEKIGNGLTKLDDSGTPQPDLAESWETPDNGKTWKFRLKEGLKWHDGKTVTSDTLVYEFSDVTVTTPDPRIIVFELEDPFAPFPVIVSKPTFRSGLLGTGEWKVDSVTVVGSYVSQLTIKDSKKNREVYNFFPTESQTKLAYKLGKIDEMYDILDPHPINTWDTVVTEEVANTNRVVTLFFNNKDPLLSDKNVRQALDYAIDKTQFPGTRAISPISPESWAFNSQVKKYSYSIDRAKELLDNTPEELLKTPIKIASAPTLLPIAESISAQWKEAGVESIVQVTSIVPNDFQVYLTIYDIPRDPDQYALWHTTQEATNVSKYESPRIDKLLEDGRLELDKEERKKIYLDFQRFLVEDLPAAFMYHPVSYNLYRK